VRDFLVF